MNKKQYLITTPIKETMCLNENHIFLNPWMDKDKLETKGYPNIQELSQNIQFSTDFYMKNFHHFAELLNKIHNQNLDISFWKIFLGPWFQNFIFVIRDRWERLFSFKKKNDFNTIKTINFNLEDLSENTHEDYMFAIKFDYLNSLIYHRIIEFNNLCTIEKVPFIKDSKSKKKSTSIITNFSNILIKLFGKNQKYVFFNTYLPFANECIINLKLKQIPLFRKEFIKPEKFSFNKEIRQKKYKIFNGSSFEKFLNENIFLFLPRVFLEGFNEIDKTILRENLPKNPKKILCGIIPSVSHIMKYIAYQKLNNNKILTLQHGGNSFKNDVGMANKIENFDINFFWSKLNSTKKNNVFNIGYTKQIYKNSKSNKGNIYLLLFNHSKYLEYPEFNEGIMFNNYLSKIIDFINLLNFDIQKKIKLRMVGFDHWEIEKKMKKIFPHIRFEKDNVKIKKVYKDARFVISTYNSTTIIEALNSNIPSCLLIDDEEINNTIINEEKKYFVELNKSKIVHTNIKSASDHINDIFTNKSVDKWWQSSFTVNTLNNFKNNICYINPNLNNVIYKFLKDEKI